MQCAFLLFFFFLNKYSGQTWAEEVAVFVLLSKTASRDHLWYGKVSRLFCGLNLTIALRNSDHSFNSTNLTRVERWALRTRPGGLRTGVLLGCLATSTKNVDAAFPEDGN